MHGFAAEIGGNFFSAWGCHASTGAADVDRAVREFAHIPAKWSRKFIAQWLRDREMVPGDSLATHHQKIQISWRDLQRERWRSFSASKVVSHDGDAMEISPASDWEHIELLAQKNARWCSEVLGVGLVGWSIAMGRLQAWGIKIPFASMSRSAARVVCVRWWRRKLRRIHALTVERAAIALGVVGGSREDKYCSTVSAGLWRARERRCREYLRNNIVVNEQGQRFTLAQLSALTVANPVNRRNELMTRVKGLESVAIERGDVCHFVTLTCPSRYHARKLEGGRAVINEKFAGGSPRDSADYLCSVWASARKRLHDAGIKVYGLRVTEPHHDGCAHWHMVLFSSPSHAAGLREVLTREAMRVDGGEPGAAQHRCKWVLIDPAKGSVVGYISKYVAKNITDDALLALENENAPVGGTVLALRGVENQRDFQISNDLALSSPNSREGNRRLNDARPMIWARVWGIRQFQFFGTPPIALWRLLRRMGAYNVQGASDCVRAAWESSHREGERRACYAGFLRAIGGVLVPRASWNFDVLTECVSGSRQYNELGLTVKKAIGLVDSIGLDYRPDSRVFSAARGGLPWTRLNKCPGVISAELITPVFFNTS